MKDSVTKIMFGVITLIAASFSAYNYSIFLIPMFVAACYATSELNVVCSLLGVLGGLVINFEADRFAKYGIMTLVVMLFLIVGKRSDNEKIIPIRSTVSIALCTFAIDFVAVWLFDYDTNFIMTCVEGFACLALIVLYNLAVFTIENNLAEIVIDNQGLIAVLAFMVTMAVCLPVNVFGMICVAEAFAIYFVLYSANRFGIGISLAWATLCGFILVEKGLDKEYILFMVLLSVGCNMLSELIPIKKLGVVIGGVLVSVLVGVLYWPYIASIEGFKALAAAFVAFIMTPQRVMVYTDRRVRNGDVYDASDEWGRIVIDRVAEFARTFRKIEYTLAGIPDTGISLNEIGDALLDFTEEFDYVVPVSKKSEISVVQDFAKRNIIVKNFVIVQNKQERKEVYITLRVKHGPLMTTNEVAEILCERTGLKLRPLSVGNNVVKREFTLLSFEEKPQFRMDMAVKKLKRTGYDISGDNYLIKEKNNGQCVMLLSDGMGSGRMAARESQELVDTMEELLSCGFDKDISVKLINSYISRRDKGEIFATMDMLIADCYSGYGNIYKHGAAPTYIKRDEWIEVIKSTSLPVGVCENAECERSVKKLFENDIILMMSDGVYESIPYDNAEDYLRDVLKGCSLDEENKNAASIVEYIYSELMCVLGNNIKDDATILVGILRRND